MCNILELKPTWASFNHSNLRLTLSNAFAKSTKQVKTGLFFLFAYNLNIGSVVLLP